MANRGKRVCETLKVVRKQIADANDIPYEISECKHQGRCPGTCAKCESEVRYIENQLSLRRAAGKAVTIVGISLSVMNVYAATEPEMPVFAHPGDTAVVAPQVGKYKVRGIVRDVTNQNEPMEGVPVAIKGTDRGTITNYDGEFTIAVDSLPARLVFSYVGYETQTIDVTENDYRGVEVFLDEAEGLLGEVVVLTPPNASPIYEYRLRGRIMMSDGEEGVGYAQLRYGLKNRKSFSADQNGYFDIQVKTLPKTFVINAPGYKPKTIEFNESNHMLRSNICLERE